MKTFAEINARDEFILKHPQWWYVVGLIFTDGNVASKKNGITIINKDKGLLERIKLGLKLNSLVTRDHPPGVYRIQFGSKRLKDFLLEIGLVEAKQRGGLPEIPEKFKWDFLRGFFDGDGSIFRVGNPTSKYGTRYQTVFYSRWESTIKAIREHLREIAAKGYPYKLQNEVYAVRYSEKDSYNLAKRFYSGGWCMERKRNRFSVMIQDKEFPRIPQLAEGAGSEPVQC